MHNLQLQKQLYSDLKAAIWWFWSFRRQQQAETSKRSKQQTKEPEKLNPASKHSQMHPKHPQNTKTITPNNKNKPMLNPNNYVQTDRYLKLGTLEPFGTFTWNPYFWNLKTFWNLYAAEPLLGTLEPSETLPLFGTRIWNLHLELLLGASAPLGTFTWNFGTSWILYLKLFPRTLEPLSTYTWDPYLEPRNLPKPSLGTLTVVVWNLQLKTLYLKPWNLLDTLLGTLAWNLLDP